MSTYSETIQARYAAFEQETDAFGRTIKVQRLRPWDATQVRKIVDSDRNNVVSDVMVASCVRSIIDDAGKERMFAPPRTEDDISVIMNALDQEGFSAALTAHMRLFGIKRGENGAIVEVEVDTAKN